MPDAPSSSEKEFESKADTRSCCCCSELTRSNAFCLLASIPGLRPSGTVMLKEFSPGFPPYFSRRKSNTYNQGTARAKSKRPERSFPLFLLRVLLNIIGRTLFYISFIICHFIYGLIDCICSICFCGLSVDSPSISCQMSRTAKITNIPTIIHSRSRCVRRSKNAFTFALLLLIQMRGMSSILLAVIGSEVFVFNDVESLDQEPLRIII